MNKRFFNIFFFLIFFSCFCFQSCNLGPKYQVPKISFKEKFSEQKENRVSSNFSLKDWWKNFNDPILNKMVEEAIDNNYDLKVALEKIEESRGFYRIERSLLWPEIDMTASLIRSSISKNLIKSTFISSYKNNYFQFGFDAIWEIDFFGKQRKKKEAAFYEIESKRENLRDVYVTVISDVARYYIEIRSLQKTISIIEKKIKVQKKINILKKSLIYSGIENEISLKENLAILERFKEKILSLHAILKKTIYSLAILLGKQPEEFHDKFQDFSNPIPFAEGKMPNYLPSSLIRSRPDIRRVEKILESQTALVSSAIANFFPSFSLLGNSYLESNKIKNFFLKKSFSWSLGALLDWPIITFGRLRAELDVEKSKEKQALLIYEKTVLEALKDVESSLVVYFSEEKKLKKIKNELSFIKEKKKLKYERYKNGLENLLYYLEEKKNFLDIKEKVIQSKRFLASDLVSLYKAFGGGEW